MVGSSFFFPDNTVLVNFALIDRIELLEALLLGRGRWCTSVAFECAKSAAFPGLQSLINVRAFLGAPIRPSPAELVHARLLRESLAGPLESATDHLGEAETIAVLTSRPDLSGSIFVSDDNGARALAQAHAIDIANTWDLLLFARNSRRLSPVAYSACLQTLRKQGRRPPHPDS